jgi:hypothetical protein
MKTKQEKLKRKILIIVKRSGLPIRTQNIADQLAQPEAVILNDLLAELIAEGRLVRNHTLLVNGDIDFVYDLGHS